MLSTPWSFICLAVVNFTRRMLGSRNNRSLWYSDPDDDTLVVPIPSFSRFPQIADVVDHFIPTLWQDCRLDVTASKTPVRLLPILRSPMIFLDVIWKRKGTHRCANIIHSSWNYCKCILKEKSQWFWWSYFGYQNKMSQNTLLFFFFSTFLRKKNTLLEGSCRMLKFYLKSFLRIFETYNRGTD